MLLTIPQSTKTEFGGRTVNDFSPSFVQPKFRPSSNPRFDSSATSLQASIAEPNMSTPHRGLPPPSAMNLPDPSQRPPPPAPQQPSLGQPLGVIPQPPSQWHGQEESMRNWLVAKAEEDKRKQEEERTRQETLRLEQRRIEQSMLRESLQGGVPPQMVPMMYAGIGGANLAQVSMDWLHQYASQLQAAQQQQIMQASPEARRDSRMIGQPPGTFQTPPTHTVQNQQPEQPSQGAPLQTTFSVYQPQGRQAPNTVPRSATHAQLPRLTTNEMQIHNPPPNNPGSAHPLQQSQSVSDQPQSSPSIYFHHWVPPHEQKSTNPQTPASKGGASGGSNAEPSSAHPGSSHLSESGEYRDSPRKRKAHGGHQAQPPPTSAGPTWTSPSFSTASSGSGKKSTPQLHQRSRSNASTKEADGKKDEVPRPPPQDWAAAVEERKARPAERVAERSFDGGERATSGARHER